jgi:hypothetical protein
MAFRLWPSTLSGLGLYLEIFLQENRVRFEPLDAATCCAEVLLWSVLSVCCRVAFVWKVILAHAMAITLNMNDFGKFLLLGARVSLFKSELCSGPLRLIMTY